MLIKTFKVVGELIADNQFPQDAMICENPIRIKRIHANVLERPEGKGKSACFNMYFSYDIKDAKKPNKGTNLFYSAYELCNGEVNEEADIVVPAGLLTLRVTSSWGDVRAKGLFVNIEYEDIIDYSNGVGLIPMK